MSEPTRIMGIDPGADTGVAVIEALRDEPQYPPPVPGVFWRIARIETVKDPDPLVRAESVRAVWLAKGRPAVAVQTIVASDGKIALWNRKSAASLVRHVAYTGMLAGWFRGAGATVVEIPSQECKSAGMKMNKAVWAETWRHEGRTSEHARDAAQIALLGVARLRRGG